MKRFPGRCVWHQSLFVSVGVVAAGLMANSRANAATFTWSNAAGGSFNFNGNWNPVGIPGPLDRPVFNLGSVGGYTVSFSSAASTVTQQLDFRNDRVTFDLNGQLYIVAQGAAIGGAGNVPIISLNDGTMSLGGATTFGSTLAGAGLTVGAGGRLFVASNTFNLADTAGQSGSLTILSSGIGSFSTLRIGSAGTASVVVSNGATLNTGLSIVGDTATGVGSVQMNGAWTSTTGVFIGNQNSGTVNIGSTGTFSGTTLSVGGGAGSTGVLNGSGVGTHSFSGQFVVGNFGDGTAALSNGTYNVGAIAVGPGASGRGQLSLTGFNTRVFSSGSINLAQNGSAGMLIESGAVLTTGGASQVGENGPASARIVGGGSTWNAASLSIGVNNAGTLEVLSGGLVSLSGLLRVGGLNSDDGNTASALLRIDGVGSAVSAGSTNIGNGVAATLLVSNGASFTTNLLTMGGFGPGTTLTLSGPGSRITSLGPVSFGLGAPASVVLGPGTVFNAIAQSVTIDDFASVTIDNATLRVGTLTRSGVLNFNSGTLEFISLNIGPTGPLGALLSTTGGKTFIVNNATISSGGALSLDGGSFSAASMTNSGQLLLNHPAATLGVSTLLTNNGLIRGGGTIGGDVLNALGEITASAGQRLRVTGGLDNQAGLLNLQTGEIDVLAAINNAALGRINGRGLLRGGSIANAGTIALSAGVSDVFGNVAQSSGAKTIITGNAVVTFYNNVTNSAGSELRVSTGSTAVFLGNVAGTAQITGPGTKIFESTATPGPLVTPGRSYMGASADLTLTHIRETGLTIEGNFAVQPNSTATGTSRLNELSIVGAPGAWVGTLDLADNALAIDYTGASPRTTVISQLLSGFAGGSWLGTGIRSSIAATTANRAIGVAEASDVGFPATFVGQPIDGTSLLLRLTVAGDANLDRAVNLDDFTSLAARFGFSSYWAQGDFNYDGVTNLDDFTILASNFGQVLSSTTPARAGPTASVPEPAIGLILTSGALFLRRQRTSPQKPA